MLTVDEAEYRAIEKTASALPPHSKEFEENMAHLISMQKGTHHHNTRISVLSRGRLIPLYAICAVVAVLLAVFPYLDKTIEAEKAKNPNEFINGLGQSSSKSTEELVIGYESFSPVFQTELSPGIILTQYHEKNASTLPTGVEVTSLTWDEREVIRYTSQATAYYQWQENGYTYILLASKDIPIDEIRSLVENTLQGHPD